MSFLGFVKIAAVAEEIRDPARNLPRTLIGSVVVVTLLYVIIVLTIAGFFSQERIGAVQDPLTAAARAAFGGIGAVGIIFAGLLATASSANASIMASSRINLAMARDRLIPGWLAGIHQELLTPHRAILVTGAVAIAFLSIGSLEDLAKIASSLQLLVYAALNLACIALRGSRPAWYRPSYLSPGYPWSQLVAAAGCLAIISYSGTWAKVAVGVLVAASLLWYVAWGRSRADLEHGVPELRRQWASLGLHAFFVPMPGAPPGRQPVPLPPKREIEPNQPRRVVVAVAIRRDESVIDGILAEASEGPHDLVIIGASRESRIRRVLFGSIPDEVASEAGCSVLMVRRYLPDHWSVRASEAVKQLREQAGLTTSPD